MRSTKLLSLLLAAAMLLPLCACAQSDAPGEGGKLTDMAGRELTLTAPAERVVVLTAADAEILYALGAGDTLVGRGSYCDYPAEIADVPSVGSGTETNLEEILALDPDVVVMAKMEQTTEQVEALANAGVPVAVTDAQTVAGVYEAIRLMGALVGRDEQAATLVSDMLGAFAELTGDAPVADGKTVYFEVSPLEYGLWTTGTGTFLDELANALGVENAFADVEGWAAISEEQVLERDPDYIVTLTMYYGEGPTPVEEIAARPGWDGLKAVRNGSIYNADSNAASRPGPRLVDAARELSAFFFPTGD